MIRPKDLAAVLRRFPDLLPHGASVLTRLPQNSALRHAAWSASDIKDGAHELKQAARAASVPLRHGHALKISSSIYGFSSWNAACAILGPRRDIKIPETVTVASSRYERVSYCSPHCMHGNFPGLVDKLMGPGTSKMCRDAAATSFAGYISEDSPSQPMLVLSHHTEDLDRLKARYPVKNVVFMNTPFEGAIWQALRMDFGHILIDRPNAFAPVSLKLFEAIVNAPLRGHNLIISTERPAGIWDFLAYFRNPEEAYGAFLNV